MANAAKADTTENSEAQRFVTPEFRVSYPHVFKAAQIQGKGEPKFSITMLFKKTTDLSRMKLAIKAAKIAEFGPDQKAWPKMDQPVQDGDSPKFADKEGYAGHWVVKATSNEANRPGLVDRNGDPITDTADFYPGCFARAAVFCRVWEYMGKNGIHFILDHVQKIKDGKSLSTRKSAADTFDPLTADDASSDEETTEEDDGF